MTQDAKDIITIRQLFWDKFYDRITLAQMQAAVAKIMSRQGSLI